MEPLLIKSCSVDRPGVLTLRGYPNERQPWTPTPRLVVDVHTICWYTIGVAYSRRIPPTVTAPSDSAEAVRCREQLTLAQRQIEESGYVLPFTIGTSFGVVEFIVVVSLDVRGEYLPRNTDLISELIAQFNGVL